MRLKIAMSRSRSSRASISNVTQSAMIAGAFIRLRRHSHQVAVRRIQCQRDGVRLCSWFLRAVFETKNKV